MEPFDSRNSVIQKLSPHCLGFAQHLFIKRDDLIHPVVSGNKWRKLKFGIKKAKESGKKELLTFGGAYSNHMVATACAGAVLGWKTSCYIRGEEQENHQNHYLFLASLYGMKLIPVSREMYREKEKLSAEFVAENPDASVIAEGGSGKEGMMGVSEIINEIPRDFDVILHASGTGTTAAGLASGLKEAGITAEKTKVFAIPVLKNQTEQAGRFEEAGIQEYIQYCEGFECGGYAKTSPELLQFCREFIRETGILIDPVYTGKALFALKHMFENGMLKKDQKILFLHTGGMLGLFSGSYMDKMSDYL